MYRNVVNTFRVVITNSRKHVTAIFHYSKHALKVQFHIILAILFRNLSGVNCLSYIFPDLMSRVSDLLIYPAVIFLNTICVSV